MIQSRFALRPPGSSSVLAALSVFLLAGPAPAAVIPTTPPNTILFTFNNSSSPSVSYGTNITTPTPGASGILASQGNTTLTVTVTGAQFGNGWNADGHIVGTSLAGSNGTTNFLINDHFANPASTTIVMKFSQPIYSLSFNYEIFPDGTTPNGSGIDKTKDSDWPDFTFKADGATVLHKLADLASGTSLAMPGGETAPQFIGSSPVYAFPGGVTEVDFVDWPATIGVNNLQFDPLGPSSTVPEPTSLVVFSLLLLGGAGGHLLRRRASRRERS